MPYEEPLTMAVCPACSTPVYRVKVGGLEYTANLTSLDAQTAMAEVLAGRRLYRIIFVGGRPLSMRPADNRVLRKLAEASPEERPLVVAGHPCTAVSRPMTPSPGPGDRRDPHEPPAARTAPSSGPQAADAPVPGAETPRSDGSPPDGPECSRCGLPCAGGTYASIDVGELTLWAAHVLECPQEGQNGA